MTAPGCPAVPQPCPASSPPAPDTDDLAFGAFLQLCLHHPGRVLPVCHDAAAGTRVGWEGAGSVSPTPKRARGRRSQACVRAVLGPQLGFTVCPSVVSPFGKSPPTPVFVIMVAIPLAQCQPPVVHTDGAVAQASHDQGAVRVTGQAGHAAVGTCGDVLGGTDGASLGACLAELLSANPPTSRKGLQRKCWGPECGAAGQK